LNRWQQKQQTFYSRRPSEPAMSNEQNIQQKSIPSNNYSDLPPTYLVSPPKKKIGPKKTKSTFAVLFPQNV
jgi:hypothetical protein